MSATAVVGISMSLSSSFAVLIGISWNFGLLVRRRLG